MIFGIDISAAQRGLSLRALKAANPDLSFVGIKSSGSGGAYVNDLCDAWMQECFEIGLICFNYDFTEDGVPAPADPAVYAQDCANQITGYAGRAGFAFDWESTTADALMANADYAAAAVRKMQTLRNSPGFYIDYRTLTNGADWSKVAATGCWKWRASYVYDGAAPYVFNGFGSPDWSLMAPTPAWPDPPAIWQYTSHGLLNGWNGYLDFNVFNGDPAGLQRLLGISSVSPSGGGVTPITEQEDHMFLAKLADSDAVYISNGVTYRHVVNGPSIDGLVSAGVVPNGTVITVESLDVLGINADVLHTSFARQGDGATGTVDLGGVVANFDSAVRTLDSHIRAISVASGSSAADLIAAIKAQWAK